MNGSARWLAWFLMFLMCASGCSLAYEGAPESTEAARKFLELVAANHVGELSWAIAWRSLLGGVIGLGLGLGVFFGVRQLNGFRWNWQHARWVRGLTGAAYGLTFAGALGWYGFWQGTVEGTEHVVIEGQIGTEVLPYVGQAGSTLLAVVYVGGDLICQQDRGLDEQQQATLEAELDRYVAGELQLEVEVLRARIADVRRCVLTVGIDEAKQRIYQRYPQLAGTVADEIMPWALDRLADQLVAALAENEQVGEFAEPIADMLARLDEAAARHGEPTLLSHQELSEHIVAVAVAPMIMMPIEHAAAGQQQAGLLALLILLLLSIGLFQLAHHLYERRPPSAPPNGSITT